MDRYVILAAGNKQFNCMNISACKFLIRVAGQKNFATIAGLKMQSEN